MAESTIKLFFKDWFTEAHRRPEHQTSLVRELARNKVICTSEYVRGVDACLCGSVWYSDQPDVIQCLNKEIPFIHYCWDLYPWQLEGKSEFCWKPHLWQPYLEQLRVCRDVWVPSACTAERVREFAGRDACVILSAVHPWDFPVTDQGYVVDVMRPYPDRNLGAVARACRELDVPCVETQANLPWPEFQRVIAGARLLVSAYEEASTGGLTLLEGYCLGKRILISDSPRMGAGDYFADRAFRFRWDSPTHLGERIENLALSPLTVDEAGLASRRRWVEENYSDAAMAARMAARLREVL